MALVAGSVAMGAFLVSSADDTVPVYAASDTLVPGAPLDAGRLDVVRVRVGGADQLYVPAGMRLPAGAVAVRTVGAGELLPATAVGSREDLSRRPLAVPLVGAAPRDLAPGIQVDVWVSTADAQTPPTKLLTEVEVYDVVTDSGGLAGAGTTTVELLLDDAGTAGLLAALAADSRIDVVPIPGTSPQR